MNPYFDIRVTDSAGSLRATGRARSGKIESQAKSLINRAFIRLTDQWNGEIGVGETLHINVFAPNGTSGQVFYTAFQGLVNKVRADGDSIYVEAVSPAAMLKVKRAKVRAWSNVPASRVLKDLLTEGGVSAGLFPPSLSSKFLHSWNTEGGTISDEIHSLIWSVSPDLFAFSGFMGDLLLGSRLDMAKQFTFFPFPTDATENGRGPDMEKIRFSLRPAGAHQVALDASTMEYYGTTETVVHAIDDFGKSYTEVILDKDPDAAVEAFAATQAAKS